MLLVYPLKGHETFETSTFLLGSVAPGNNLACQGLAVTVSTEGFFTVSVDLLPGENAFELQEQSASGDVLETTTLPIIRKAALPFEPVEIAPEACAHFVMPHEFAQPVQPISVSPGDTLVLACIAPKGSTVLCQLDGLLDEYLELQPIAPIETRQGVFAQLHHVQCPWPDEGVFAQTFLVPLQQEPLVGVPIQYHIHSPQNYWTQNSLGTLTVLDRDQPQWVEVIAQNTLHRSAPTNGARLSPLSKGVQGQVIGTNGDSVQIQWAPGHQSWLTQADIESHSMPKLPLIQPLSFIHASQTSSGQIEIAIPLTYPVSLYEHLAPHQITLTLSGVVSYCDFIHYHPGVFNEGLRQVTWDQSTPETVTITIHLESDLIGYSSAFDPDKGGLVLRLKTQKALANRSVIVAIDAGHGGDENGSTAPDGTPEKNLNLSLAQKLFEALKAEPGITPVLIRDCDETVSLEERLERAQAENADFFLSIHHNALPDGRDPLKEQGISTYYYHPFVLPMAKSIQSHLVQNSNLKDYGVLYDSLFVTRQTAMPGILVELGFLTHPTDAAYCLSDAGQSNAVNGLTAGLLQILKTH